MHRSRDWRGVKNFDMFLVVSLTSSGQEHAWLRQTKEVYEPAYLRDSRRDGAGCASPDEALPWVAKIPTTRYGMIGVRPVATFD
jgi:hypothetical protein